MSVALRRDIHRGLAWVGTASAVIAVLDIVATILVLRFWVSKGDYGVVTTVVTLMFALELASELGLAAAIVARGPHDQQQLSTLFWLNLLLGFGIYGVIFFAAPSFARLHQHAVLVDVLRIFGLMLVLRTAYATQQAMLKRELRFRDMSLVRIVANLADFAAKLASAAAGLGLWCFVLGPLTRQLFYVLGTNFYARWLPSLTFKPSRVLPDIKFGLRSTGGEVLYQLYSNLDYQVVSLYFGKEALGLYRAAYEIVLEPVRFMSGIVTAVAFPAFAKLRDDSAAVAAQFIGFCRHNLIVVLSFVAAIAVTAPDALALIIGPEYAAAGDAVRVLALVAVLRSLSHLGPPLFDGLGRPELTLRYQLAAALALSTMFFLFAELVGPQLGYVSVAAAWAVGYPIAFAVLSVFLFRLLSLTVGSFIKAMVPVVLLVTAGAALCLGVALAVGSLPLLARVLLPAGTMAAVAVVGYFRLSRGLAGLASKPEIQDTSPHV